MHSVRKWLLRKEWQVVFTRRKEGEEEAPAKAKKAKKDAAPAEPVSEKKKKKKKEKA